MAKQAHLTDGTVLEFPDETDESVIDSAVKSHIKPEKGVINRFSSGVGGSVLEQIAALPGVDSEWISNAIKESEGIATGTAGSAGKVVGDVAPYMMMGGGLAAQSLKTGLLSGLTTEGDAKERLTTGVESGLVNALLGKALGSTASLVGNKLKESAEKAAVRNIDMAGATKALEEGRKAGFVVSPSDVNPTWFNNLLSSIGGKAALNQAQQSRNAVPATALARETLGVSKTTPLNQETFDKVVADNMKPYSDLASLPEPLPLAKGYSSPHKVYNATDDLKELQLLRDEVRQLSKSQELNYSKQNAIDLDAAKAKIGEINARFENRAVSAGHPEYIGKFNDARVNLAKLATVEDAVNKVTGRIDAREFGKLIDRKAPLTGGLRVAGEFEQAFPMSIREPEKVPSEFVNQLMRGIMPFAVGGAAYGSSQDPKSAILSGVATMAAPTAARKLLLSKGYQKAFANIPKETPSSVLSIIDAILSNEATRRSIPAISKEITYAP